MLTQEEFIAAAIELEIAVLRVVREHNPPTVLGLEAIFSAGFHAMDMLIRERADSDMEPEQILLILSLLEEQIAGLRKKLVQ